MLSDAEQARLQSIALVIFYDVVNLCCVCVLFGVFLLEAYLALDFFLVRGLKRSSRRMLFVCCVLIFFINLWDFILQCKRNFLAVSLTLLAEGGGDLSDRAEAFNEATIPWAVQENWALNFNLFIGDLIVVWRAWAICKEHRVVRWALVLLIAVNIVFNIVDVALDEVDKIEGVSQTALDTAGIFLSLGVNVASTAAIGWKALKYYQSGQKLNKLFLLLVESGVIFCVFQTLNAVFTAMSEFVPPESAGNIIPIVRTIILGLFNGLTVLYPTSVILLVLGFHEQDSLHQGTLHPDGRSDSDRDTRQPHGYRAAGMEELSTIEFILNANSSTTSAATNLSRDSH